MRNKSFRRCTFRRRGCFAVVTPELHEGAAKYIPICSVDDEEIEDCVACTYHCDQVSYNRRAIEIGKPATGAERFEVFEDGGECRAALCLYVN